MPRSGFTGLRSAWPQALTLAPGPTPAANLRRCLASDFHILGSAWPQALFTGAEPHLQRELTLMPRLGFPDPRLRHAAPARVPRWGPRHGRRRALQPR